MSPFLPHPWHVASLNLHLSALWFVSLHLWHASRSHPVVHCGGVTICIAGSGSFNCCAFLQLLHSSGLTQWSFFKQAWLPLLAFSWCYHSLVHTLACHTICPPNSYRICNVLKIYPARPHTLWCSHQALWRLYILMHLLTWVLSAAKSNVSMRPRVKLAQVGAPMATCFW